MSQRNDLARMLPPDAFAKIKQDAVSGGGEMSDAVGDHRVEEARRPASMSAPAARDRRWVHQVTIETTTDDIAARKKMDPLAYRLEMLEGAPRAVNW